MYFRSSDVLFYTYCITYTYYIATYVCMYINFDASPRSTACALIRTSLGLLEQSDTSEKPPPNPNFLGVCGGNPTFRVNRNFAKPNDLLEQ